MFTPGQVSERLQVPGSTLRRWSDRFADYLSPRTSKHRVYTADDYEILRKVRDMSAAGHGLKYIGDVLKIFEPGSNPPPPIEEPQAPAAEEPAQDPNNNALMVIGFARELGSHDYQLAELRRLIDAQDQKLKDLSTWLDLPWYARLFKRPPR